MRFTYAYMSHFSLLGRCRAAQHKQHSTCTCTSTCTCRSSRHDCAGGDWGAKVSKTLGIFHSDHCKGIHTNYSEALPQLWNPLHVLQLVNALMPVLDRMPIFLSRAEIQNVKDSKHWIDHERGDCSRAVTPTALSHQQHCHTNSIDMMLRHQQWHTLCLGAKFSLHTLHVCDSLGNSLASKGLLHRLSFGGLISGLFIFVNTLWQATLLSKPQSLRRWGMV